MLQYSASGDRRRSFQLLKKFSHIALIGLLTVHMARPAGSGEMVPQSDSQRPVKAVLELFTSQGCLSCPPADALMRTYADARDVMVLSLPVDYWDYLGWKDTLANPKNSERQRAYSRTLGFGSVYTPQVVVNGTTQAVGSNRVEIDSAIEQSKTKFAKDRIPVRLWRHEGIYNIDLGSHTEGGTEKQATVWFVVVQKTAEVPVKGGENGGKTLVYTNVVRELVPVGVWEGHAKNLQVASGSVMRPEGEDKAVIVQDAMSGEIIGAAYISN